MRVKGPHLSARVQRASIGNIGVDHVTERDNSSPEADTPEQQSLSGLLDTPELLRVRILPAQFARALGVSKQSVSRWIRDGWVMLAADGRLDPVVAIGQLLRRCDPGRLRARWLRQAITDVQTLREAAGQADQRVAAVEGKLNAALARITYLESFSDDLDCMLDRVLELVVERESDLRATVTSEEFAALVSDIESDAATICGDASDVDVDAAIDAYIESNEAPRAIHEAEGNGGDAP